MCVIFFDRYIIRAYKLTKNIDENSKLIAF